MSIQIKKPLNDLLLIKIDPELTEKEGVYIPDDMREESGYATVLMVSPDLMIKTDLVGSRIMYKKGLPMLLTKDDGESNALIPYRGVQAILE